jgi:hypothetical protein
VKVVDYCDPFFAGKLTRAKSLVTCVECFAIVSVQFAILDYFLLFW